MRKGCKQRCIGISGRLGNWFTFTVAVSILSFSVSGQAITLEDLQDQLSGQPVVRGLFTQVRSMEMLNAPLESEGEFLLAKEKGLQWHQTQPFPVKLVLTQTKLSQQFSGGEASVVSAEENPMVFYFSHVFLSLFSGDTRQLKEQFELSLTDSINHEGWQLVLTPNSAPLNAVFQSIQLSGGQYINELILEEVRGDKTEITFHDQQSANTDLTAEESRGFKI
ncbi:LolA family protein [Photobacterium satsumensis]|uniref:LolA family protein n=1 Tax=Photobacterium satsumensis TaxID=2910239 RepID=UPI003D0B7590